MSSNGSAIGHSPLFWAYRHRVTQAQKKNLDRHAGLNFPCAPCGDAFRAIMTLIAQEYAMSVAEQHAGKPLSPHKKAPPFDWQDPLDLEGQLTEDERMVR